jgi:hypothetical protein
VPREEHTAAPPSFYSGIPGEIQRELL